MPFVVLASSADNQGRRITVEVSLSGADAINGPMTVTRTAGCVYDRVVVGRPGTRKAFQCPGTSASISQATLTASGYTTLTSLVSGGVTFGTTEV